MKGFFDMSTKIAIGSDHAGFALKCEIMKWLRDNNIEFIELGCTDGSSCDYPLVAKEVCDKITDGTVDKAILICGTGIGISMSANKIKGIRAALCTDAYTAKYTRLHNDANVLCMGGRVTGAGVACEMVEIFLNTEFEGGRHQRRVDQITAIENE
jgi:ribose 5-phosphate isomerase B